MPALFTPRANLVARIALLAIAVATVAAPAVVMAWVRTPWARGVQRRVVQPAAFDHAFHAGTMHVDCRFCHAGADQAASAGLPSTQLCAACPTRLWMSSDQLAPVRRSLATGRPIAWRRVNELPAFVYFDHAMHAWKGVGCETCHGRVDTMRTVAQVAPLTMRWCLDCHRHAAPDQRRLTNCTTCHR
jgi:hypothetical protein